MPQVINVKFTDNSEAIKAELSNKVSGWLKAIGEDAASTAAKVLTDTNTIDTGTLKNSISSAVIESEKQVHIGTNVHYAPYHEFGTGKYASDGTGRQGGWNYQDADGNWHHTYGVPAKHFLQFGASAHQEEYKAMLEQTLKN